MKKNILLSILIAVYLLGLLSSIVLLASGDANKDSGTKRSKFASIGQLNKKENAIGIIKIEGPISFVSDENPSILFANPQRGAGFWLRQMEVAVTNDNIKAVIIRVNSPGGTVGASQELHAGVARIKAAGKPVVVSIADISASGGYYATVGADRMFANPGSVVGSIGVILGSIEFSELLKKLGIKYQAITSGANKDILSPYKQMTESQRAFLQTMVSNTYEQFLTAVVEGRKRDKTIIRPLADGSVFTGDQAVQNGLIDELGTFEDVVNYTKTTYNLSQASVGLITPEVSSFKLADLLSMTFSKSTPQVNVSLGSETLLGNAPILYLYQF